MPSHILDDDSIAMEFAILKADVSIVVSLLLINVSIKPQTPIQTHSKDEPNHSHGKPAATSSRYAYLNRESAGWPPPNNAEEPKCLDSIHRTI